MADNLDDLAEEAPSDHDHESPAPTHSVDVGKDGLPVDVIQPGDSSRDKLTREEEEEGREEEEKSEDRELAVRARRFATIMNMLNSLLGAGILSVPNTFVNTGIVLSLVLLLFMGAISLIGTWMVIILAKKTGTKGKAIAQTNVPTIIYGILFPIGDFVLSERLPKIGKRINAAKLSRAIIIPTRY